MKGPQNPLFTDTTITSAFTAAYAWKVAMLAAGWTCVGSGDGSANFSTSGDVITGSNSGAHGIDNAKSWFILKSPAAVAGSFIYLCYQCVSFVSTTADTVRFKYSRTGWSGNGSTSKTVVPSITGGETEVVIIGAGTDAAPTGVNLFTPRGDPNSLSTNLAGFADTTAPFGWSFWTYQLEASSQTNATSKPRFMMDPLLRPGTADTDAYAIHAHGASTTNTVWEPANLVTTQPAKAANASGTYSSAPALYQYDGSEGFPPGAGNTGAPVDVWSGNYTLLPVVYGSTTLGMVGISTLMYQVAQSQLAATARADLFTAVTTKDFIWIGGYALPWKGSDPAIGSWTTFNADIWDLTPTLGDKKGDASHIIEAGDTLVGVGTVERWLFPGSLIEAGDTLVATGTHSINGSAAITEVGDTLTAGAPASLDTTAPAITNFSPAGGTQILPGTLLTFDITDTALRLVAVVAYYPDGIYEVVHDGTDFAAGYITTSTRSVISGGYHFSVLRTGGWLQAPTLRFPVVDGGGNIGVIS